MKYLKRGEIYYVNLGDNIGSELNKERPCLVVQNDIGNKHSPTTIIVPISTSSNKHLPTHVALKHEMMELDLKSIEGTILTEQIRTVDKKRFKNKIGSISINALKAVDKAILISMGIQA